MRDTQCSFLFYWSSLERREELQALHLCGGRCETPRSSFMSADVALEHMWALNSLKKICISIALDHYPLFAFTSFPNMLPPPPPVGFSPFFFSHLIQIVIIPIFTPTTFIKKDKQNFFVTTILNLSKIIALFVA